MKHTVDTLNSAIESVAERVWGSQARAPVAQTIDGDGEPVRLTNGSFEQDYADTDEAAFDLVETWAGSVDAKIVEDALNAAADEAPRCECGEPMRPARGCAGFVKVCCCDHEAP